MILSGLLYVPETLTGTLPPRFKNLLGWTGIPADSSIVLRFSFIKETSAYLGS